MKHFDIPSDVIWANYIETYVHYVGEDTYNKVEAVKDKYPKYFPWHHLYKSIPKEVHEAYRDEKYPNRNKPIKCDGGGIMKLMEESTIKEYKIPNKSFKELWKDFENLYKEAAAKEKAIYAKNKKLWDKHYKKYNLEYRE